MPKLVIINGPPASGKTTLEHVITDKLGLPVLGKDTLKEFMFDKLGTADREWSAIVGSAAVEMLYAYAEMMLAKGKDVVIENAFWAEFAAPHIKDICEQTQCEVLELYCHADAATRERRNQQRLASGNRHSGYVDTELKFDDAIDNDRFRPIGIGKLVRIDTTHLDEAGYAGILRTITDFLQVASLA